MHPIFPKFKELYKNISTAIPYPECSDPNTRSANFAYNLDFPNSIVLRLRNDCLFGYILDIQMETQHALPNALQFQKGIGV